MKKKAKYSYNDLLEGIGAKIKMLRESKNMTQSQLAWNCDFEKASMSRIESGKTNVTFLTLLKISKELNVPVGDLIPD